MPAGPNRYNLGVTHNQDLLRTQIKTLTYTMQRINFFILPTALLLLAPSCGNGGGSVSFDASEDWLMIPASDNGATVTLRILADGENILGEAQTIRLATGSADYNIPVDISAYRGKELTLSIDGARKSDLSLSGIQQLPEKEVVIDEAYRQIYHFTPDFGWTNDPNGMVYLDGKWHLAYQSNPYGTRHHNMHWGNAVSDDLVHWEDLPAIIAPDSLGAVFSGSTVVDTHNSTGFGEGALVAMYTSASRSQRQSLAYSLDGGFNYTKYEGNPVLSEPDIPDFRDPKILRHGDTWIVSIAAGDRIIFYGSTNLRDWTKLSEFGSETGAHGGVWECPDLIPMRVGSATKWLLIVNINPGGPNGGSATQYFIGDFDGTSFTADDLAYPLWMDEGMDNYAGVTFSNTDDRHVLMGWMSNWLYAQDTPTVNFRNGMTIARDLSLREGDKGLYLASSPSPEILSARGARNDFEPELADGKWSTDRMLENNSGAYEICFTAIPGTSGKLGLKLYNTKGEELAYDFDFNELSLTLDRSRSGKTDFSGEFAGNRISAGLRPAASYDVRLFIDRHSAEMFINDGDVSFTNIFFPTEVLNGVELTSDDARINGLTVYELR